MLKKEGKFDTPKTPFFVSVREVEGRVLIDAIFKHRKSLEEPNVFDMVVFARRARVKFDEPAGLVRIDLEQSETSGDTAKPFIFSINGRQELQYPLPKDQKLQFEKRIQEMTNAELTEQQAVLREKIRRERLRQALAAALWIGSGRIERVTWPEVGQAFSDFPIWKKRNDEFETEKSFRAALAAGAICFIWVGAPVAIRAARRDFLSVFFVCFLPIIGVYYPMMLAGVNSSKEGVVPPLVVFGGNLVLILAGSYIIWKVRRH